MSKTNSEHDSEPYSVTASPYLCYRSLIQLYMALSTGTFYSLTARTYSEPLSVEHRISFAVEVKTASGNWKHPLPLEIIFSARFQWLLCYRNG